MKLWQCQMESDQGAGEADEAEEEVETDESREESGAENYEDGTDEGGGDEDESEEGGDVREKETEENADEEEEEEDAETFGYEKIEKSEVEQLDCSSMGYRFKSTTSKNLNQLNHLMMMMICLNCNQRLVLLLNLLRRVLSIHTDPYQALKITCTKTNK